MCENPDCKKTHAIIPSFSVPGCSIGTKELDDFIKARAEGKTIDKAGQCFIDAGMSPDYPESIDKRLKKYRTRIETVFAPITERFSAYFFLILNIAGNATPVTKLNQLCKNRGFNPVLFSRINILTFHKNNSNPSFSLNPIFKPPP